MGTRIGEEEIRCQTIAATAHEELTEVEPLLTKANEALEQLTKRDIGEVKAYVHPPSQVEKVMRALMILSKKSTKKQDFVNLFVYLEGKRRYMGRSKERFSEC